jgi:lipopolysaccharide/colanic/teichoic acid biosynthesis glycosyltransferase
VLRRHVTALRLALMLADVALASALFVAISIVRFGPSWQQTWSSLGLSPWLLAVLAGAGWSLILWLLGLYRLRARWSWRSEWLDIIRAVLLVGVGVFCALFLFKLPNVSRLFLLSLFVAQGTGTLASRAVLRAVFETIRSRGYNARYLLVVGDGPQARSFARRVSAHRQLGIRVVGFLRGPGLNDPPPGEVAIEPVLGEPVTSGREADPVSHGAWSPSGRNPQVIGSIEDLEQLLHTAVVDEVAICLPVEAWRFVEPISRLCEEEGRVVRIPLEDPSTLVPSGGRVEDFDGIQVVSLVYGPDRALSLIAKRVLDIALASLALIALSPLLLAVSVLVAARDGRPILFTQTRVGVHGRPFKVVKFRTMVPDAETRLAELEAANEIRGHAFKVTNDPRLSRTGGLLRRTSLDELPQLLNVLRGEMSLVGPRPPLPTEVAQYDIWHRRRLSMKPGITGLWQVAARREAEFDRWVAMDLDYIDRWSLWLDLKIMARTIPAMLGGEGR